jgi:hypothetical protein
MGKLEDFYRQQQAATAAQATPSEVLYNELVAACREIIDQVVANAHKNPPKRYAWLEDQNGQQVVGWEVSNDTASDRTTSCHILSDGRLASADEVTRGRARVLVVTGIITLRPINRAMSNEECWAEGLPCLAGLKSLCRSMTTLPCNHGFSNHPNFKHWWKISH